MLGCIHGTLECTVSAILDFKTFCKQENNINTCCLPVRDKEEQQLTVEKIYWSVLCDFSHSTEENRENN